MELPIKYRLYQNSLWVKSGEEEVWKVARVNVSAGVLTPISQNYGEDFIWRYETPVGWKGRYLYRDILKLPKGHNGIDFTAPNDTALYAPFSGKITELLTRDGLGIRLTGDKYQAIFFHLKKFLVSINDEVQQGQLIALTDNTGTASTAAHLHMGIRMADWKDDGDKMRGYFDFRNLIDNLHVYKVPDKEGMWLQHKITGAVYEYKDGLLKHLDDKPKMVKQPDGSFEKHYELIDAVLKKMKKGIEPNSLRGIDEVEFQKYKHLLVI